MSVRSWLLPAAVLATGMLLAFTSPASAQPQPLPGAASMRAHASGASGPAVAGELARASLDAASRAWWRRWQADALSVSDRQAMARDVSALPQVLVDAGVLPGEGTHAWPIGCTKFAHELDRVLEQARTPMGLLAWNDWNAVHRLQCGPRPGLAAQVQASLAHWPASSGLPASALPWSVVLLSDVPDERWSCMRQSLPSAWRQGLDRHEGLRWVARQCGLEPAWVFGQAQACFGCLSHPRGPRRALFEAVVGVP